MFVLQVNSEETKIKRTEPFQSVPDVDDRTVYVVSPDVNNPFILFKLQNILPQVRIVFFHPNVQGEITHVYHVVILVMLIGCMMWVTGDPLTPSGMQVFPKFNDFF